ncbi:unnamed protein product [Closterium sp. NIES-64]|nr:unnamed protein product [Closterium sp. NIES-64]
MPLHVQTSEPSHLEAFQFGPNTDEAAVHSTPPLSPDQLSPRSDESKEVNFDDAEEMPALSSFATTEASSSAGAAGGEVLDDQRDGDRESCDSRESTSAWSTAYTTEAFFHQRSIRVISFDLPGTGFSDPLPLQATTTTASFASAVADDIKQLAQQLHVVPGLWVVGFGLGSPLAHAAAERLGQGLVAGLLLLGPPGVLNTGECGDATEEIRGRERAMHAEVEERRPGGQPEVVMSWQQAGGVWQLVQQSFRGRVASAVLRIVVPRVLVQSVVALLRISPAVLKWIVTATSLRPISPRVVSLICDGLLDALQQGDLPYLLNLLVLTLQPHNTQPSQTANNPFFSGPVYTYKVFDEPRSQNLLPEAMFEGRDAS